MRELAEAHQRRGHERQPASRVGAGGVLENPEIHLERRLQHPGLHLLLLRVVHAPRRLAHVPLELSLEVLLLRVRVVAVTEGLHALLLSLSLLLLRASLADHLPLVRAFLPVLLPGENLRGFLRLQREDTLVEPNLEERRQRRRVAAAPVLLHQLRHHVKRLEGGVALHVRLDGVGDGAGDGVGRGAVHVAQVGHERRQDVGAVVEVRQRFQQDAQAPERGGRVRSALPALRPALPLAPATPHQHSDEVSVHLQQPRLEVPQLLRLLAHLHRQLLRRGRSDPVPRAHVFKHEHHGERREPRDLPVPVLAQLAHLPQVRPLALRVLHDPLARRADSSLDRLAALIRGHLLLERGGGSRLAQSRARRGVHVVLGVAVVALVVALVVVVALAVLLLVPPLVGG